ncbi:MAG: sterol desaturase/sphingolipid hydroxylase (fatty acid hydroxylase superfamily) [Maricaulis maris]|jgi:sterol desaturase/sphingolipid hydroxylase (fatty acid hydroxylase superfamily)
MLVYLFTAALFTLIFTREVIAPASGASCDKRWRIFAGSLNLANLAVVLGAGWLFNGWIGRHALLPLPDSVPALVQSLIIFLAASLLAYGWHRLTHTSDTLWRCVHQLHHSPSRIEALTAFYVHPIDSFLATLLNAVVAYWIFGASPLVASLVLALVSVFNLVAHADLKTPWWLGLFLQRPEMHRLHHERHSHRSNYGLPLWDMVFGTWRNPRLGTVECGFSADREFKVREMLLMQDVGG